MIEFIHEVFDQENKNYWFFPYKWELKMNTENFENLTFNAFDKENLFFNTRGFSNTTYFTPETLKIMIKENSDNSFSVLHLHTRS